MPRGPRAWSDWELAEMAHLRRADWTARSLATLYGVTERCIQRRLRAMGLGPRRGVSSAATCKTD